MRAVGRIEVGREVEVSGALALRECGRCRARPALCEGGEPRAAVVVCRSCWQVASSREAPPGRRVIELDFVVDLWNRRQAALTMEVVRCCGTCRSWGGPWTSRGTRDLELRGCWERSPKGMRNLVRTYRHMGLACELHEERAAPRREPC